MADRNLAGYALAALAGAALFVLMIGLIAGIYDGMTARKCNAMGMVMLEGKPYRCEPMEAPRNG